MSFDQFLDQAWTDHATDAAAVAARLEAEGLALVTQEDRVVPMAHLAHHVFGEHLGRWDDGLHWLARLAALPACTPGSPAAQAPYRFAAALRLASGHIDGRPALDASEALRVTALAAANLGSHDATRAAALLDDAEARAEAAALPDKDPAHRALAIAGNGIAGTLEEKADRSPAERALMIRAAQVARRYWARAGTWLETERAEYRLAMTWLQAGDLPGARQHAQNCLEIVRAHGDVPLELFFGWEALGRVERAASNVTGHAQALAQAESAFQGLAEGDRGWCGKSLQALRAPPAA